MRILLDTNILIHREGRTVIRDDIGTLFRWMDTLGYVKCIHPSTRAEINKYADAETVRVLRAKIGSYSVLKTIAPDHPAISAIRAGDQTPNDVIDTSLLLEVVADRVDALITEDRGIHRKARLLGVEASVFTIDAFLEKVTGENPELADYSVLAVKKAYFGELDLSDPFFDSFRADYAAFDRWFNKKADETAYICTSENGQLLAFLYVKREGRDENYGDISPRFLPKPRLKIGTFKVIANGFKLGERFLKIVFDNALRYSVQEIYVTIFEARPEHDRLIRLLGDWGFARHGDKLSASGKEIVLTRDFTPHADLVDPRRSYPYVSSRVRKYIVPIRPDYHTELLPDSILRTESPASFTENRPNRNAISKAYISRSIERGLTLGDLIVFYRTGTGEAPAHYTAVATTLGVVQDVITNIPSKEDFLKHSRKRSVFSDAELAKWWDFAPRNRPFVVHFLYVSSFPKRPNLSQLKAAGIIANAPRGFEALSDPAFDKLLTITNADSRLVIS